MWNDGWHRADRQAGCPQVTADANTGTKTDTVGDDRGEAPAGTVVRNVAQVHYTGASSGEVSDDTTRATELRMQALPRFRPWRRDRGNPSRRDSSR